jgi:ElaB/YqjD/DUF883 family membrane-anchored ribosome-binding protein
MSGSLLIILLIITVAIAISQFGIILYFLNFIKKNELHDGVVKEAQTKSAALIEEAVSKATELVTDAEKKSLSHVEESSKSIESLAAQVNKSLESMAGDAKVKLEKTAGVAENTFKETTANAQTTYDSFVKEAEASMKSMLSQDRQLLEQKTDQAITETSSMFQTFMKDVTTQVRKELDGEIKKANEAVEVYKTERLQAINEKVIDILEEVLLETLGKKLSLKDEGEFVYQALEQAKKEHAFS